MLFVIPILAILSAPALWMILGRPRFLDRTGAPERAAGISIVIPARDEEAHIGTCLDALFAGDYPADRFEVIVADDGSPRQSAPTLSISSSKNTGFIDPASTSALAPS